MACIDRRPRCDSLDSSTVPEPLTQLIALLGWIGGAIGVLTALLAAVGAISLTPSGAIAISLPGGFTLTAIAPLAGAVVAFLVALALCVMIGLSVDDRCRHRAGLSECVAGVAIEVVPSFSSTLDDLLPFSAMHNRVDLVAKSRFWDVIEDGQAFVFCTEAEQLDGRSEILRCYFFDSQVCDAARGALAGGILAGLGGVVAAALVVAAIGCVTVILCLISILLAIVIAATAVLIGALAGGQIGKALSDEGSATGTDGATIMVGHLATMHGNMLRREFDSKANVLYWVTSASLHGLSRSRQPFSYCEINDELATDGCGRSPVDPSTGQPPGPIPPPPLH